MWVTTSLSSLRATDQACAWLCRRSAIAVADSFTNLMSKPALGFCRMWVAIITGSPSSQLTQPVLALQFVSGHCAWHYLKPPLKIYPWLCRMWAAAVSGVTLSLLIKLTIDLAVCELLYFQTLFQLHWSSQSLALQGVSCCVHGAILGLLLKCVFLAL